MFNEGFASPMTHALRAELEARARRARGAVLTATTLANSGHPGGSFSSMEMYTVLYSCARLRSDEPRWPMRDRIVVSHGHTSPGVYASLANAGFFPMEEFEAHFRQAGSVFEGHVERSVPGVEWSTGNLGQGLSVGAGFAIGARITGEDWRTYVAMSDGEQNKGQVAEARRLVVKEGLASVTAIIDLNGIQISGRTSDVMPVDVAKDFAADGWRVVEIDGHDLTEVYDALRDASLGVEPTAIVAHTVIGKGVSFMEGEAEFHGRGLSADEYARAMDELGLEPDLDAARELRSKPFAVSPLPVQAEALALCAGEPRTYDVDQSTDNRSAWGAALVDLADGNPTLPMAVYDCDLAVSVKTEAFWKRFPQRFIQCGVGEHNAATASGATSVCGVLTFWSDFGVFGVDEVYNQQRLNDINGAGLKLVVTHCGLDVGEDGKTHQCLDYIGAFRDFFGWRVIVPADPNQTDRAVRAAAAMEGNVCVAMGRSKLPVIAGVDGAPLFGAAYDFRYGEIVWAREGEDACVLVTGTVTGAAVRAADALAAEGIRVAVGVVACPLHLDDEAMRAAASASALVTFEDHTVHTGLGASVAEWLAENGAGVPLVRHGVERYMESGASSAVLVDARLDEASMTAAIREAVGR